ncbi:MAG: transcription termination/antitermination protein NusG [Candidatus Binatia bacterium]
MGEIMPSSPQWFVISTKARRERFAQEQLMRRGVDTFLPRIVEPARLRPKPAVAPLFPGYLFVRIDLDEQYLDVVWTPGVRRFIGFGALPCALDDAVIEFLHARMGREGILYRAAPAFREGDVVRITRGPFEGLIGIIENPGCGRGRVRVLMELLRRQTRVEVPLHIIERASA